MTHSPLYIAIVVAAAVVVFGTQALLSRRRIRRARETALAAATLPVSSLGDPASAARAFDAQPFVAVGHVGGGLADIVWVASDPNADEVELRFSIQAVRQQFLGSRMHTVLLVHNIPAAEVLQRLSAIDAKLVPHGDAAQALWAAAFGRPR